MYAWRTSLGSGELRKFVLKHYLYLFLLFIFPSMNLSALSSWLPAFCVVGSLKPFHSISFVHFSILGNWLNSHHSASYWIHDSNGRITCQDAFTRICHGGRCKHGDQSNARELYRHTEIFCYERHEEGTILLYLVLFVLVIQSFVSFLFRSFSSFLLVRYASFFDCLFSLLASSVVCLVHPFNEFLISSCLVIPWSQRLSLFLSKSGNTRCKAFELAFAFLPIHMLKMQVQTLVQEN